MYILSGTYINLLIDWTHDSSTYTNNKWNLVAFGLILAFMTGIIQIAMQIYCKSPLYQYQLELTENAGYNPEQNGLLSHLDALPHKEDLILFGLNWLNDISCLWNKVLSAAIGWSLLTPNQTNSILMQFVTAMTATFLFLFVGYILSDYKRRIQKDILMEIRDLKKQLMTQQDIMNGDEDDESEYEDEDALMNRIVLDKQKLIFFDQLQATYDLAFAVSVSYSWESFLAISVKNVFGNNVLNRFVAHLFLTVFVAFIFSQFGLELVDLKRQRLREAKVEQSRLRRESLHSKVKKVKEIKKREIQNEPVNLQICKTERSVQNVSDNEP